MIWAVKGGGSLPKATFLRENELFFRNKEETTRVGLNYRGPVSDGVAQAISNNGYVGGTTARAFESLLVVFALHEPANETILSQRVPGKDLYVTWDDFKPRLFGKHACVIRATLLQHSAAICLNHYLFNSLALRHPLRLAALTAA